MGGGWGKRLSLPTTDRVRYLLWAAAGNPTWQVWELTATRGQEGPHKSTNGVRWSKHQTIRLAAESASEGKSCGQFASSTNGKAQLHGQRSSAHLYPNGRGMVTHIYSVQPHHRSCRCNTHGHHAHLNLATYMYVINYTIM